MRFARLPLLAFHFIFYPRANGLNFSKATLEYVVTKVKPSRYFGSNCKASAPLVGFGK
jgi:hypothetical protein